MPVCENAEALAQGLSGQLPSCALVGIDGWTGVGKTTLAASLSKALQGATIDLDSFLDRDRKCFVDALRLGELRDALESAASPVFVSGICLKEALDRVGFTPNIHIYVKRMALWGWADEDELGDADTVPEVDPTGGAAEMRRELRAYHQQWQPHLKADWEFHWFEDRV